MASLGQKRKLAVGTAALPETRPRTAARQDGPEAPRSLPDIVNRTVEITHNSTFWLELGALSCCVSLMSLFASAYLPHLFPAVEIDGEPASIETS